MTIEEAIAYIEAQGGTVEQVEQGYLFTEPVTGRSAVLSAAQLIALVEEEQAQGFLAGWDVDAMGAVPMKPIVDADGHDRPYTPPDEPPAAPYGQEVDVEEAQRRLNLYQDLRAEKPTAGLAQPETITDAEGRTWVRTTPEGAWTILSEPGEVAKLQRQIQAMERQLTVKQANGMPIQTDLRILESLRSNLQSLIAPEEEQVGQQYGSFEEANTAAPEGFRATPKLVQGRTVWTIERAPEATSLDAWIDEMLVTAAREGRQLTDDESALIYGLDKTRDMVERKQISVVEAFQLVAPLAQNEEQFRYLMESLLGDLGWELPPEQVETLVQTNAPLTKQAVEEAKVGLPGEKGRGPTNGLEEKLAAQKEEKGIFGEKPSVTPEEAAPEEAVTGAQGLKDQFQRAAAAEEPPDFMSQAEAFAGPGKHDPQFIESLARNFQHQWERKTGQTVDGVEDVEEEAPERVPVEQPSLFKTPETGLRDPAAGLGITAPQNGLKAGVKAAALVTARKQSLGLTTQQQASLGAGQMAQARQMKELGIVEFMRQQGPKKPLFTTGLDLTARVRGMAGGGGLPETPPTPPAVPTATGKGNGLMDDLQELGRLERGQRLQQKFLRRGRKRTLFR